MHICYTEKADQNLFLTEIQMQGSKSTMEEAKGLHLIDEEGRVVLPTIVRNVLKWDEKTPVEIWANPKDHEIVIRQHIFQCLSCGATEHLKPFHKKYICEECQKLISKL